MADTQEPYGADADYADPGYQADKVKRYPLNTKEHARSALAYFSMEKNAAKYTAAQRTKIMARIKAACKKFGIEIAGDAAPTEPPAGSNAANSSMERMFTPGGAEVRSSGGSGRRIGGYAAVFGARSRRLPFGHEVVDPAFFNASRNANWPGAAGGGVVARWDHDSARLLGSTSAGTLTLSVDSRGLDYSVDLPECRADLYELVGRRDVAQASFTFADAQDDWSYADGQPLRRLLSGQLLDVAPVGAEVAAYPAASCGLRSLARYVGADVAEVEMRARNGELRRFFERSDRPSARRPLYEIQHENMQRLLTLRAKQMAWH